MAHGKYELNVHIAITVCLNTLHYVAVPNQLKC